MNPAGLSTLIEMLEFRARESAGQVAFTMNGQSSTFDQVWQGVNRCASYLLDCGLQPGERALLALPNSAEFFSAFYGIQRAGGIAVPVFPGSGVERILSLAGLCEARLVFVPSQLPTEILSKYRAAADQHGLAVVTVQDSARTRLRQSFPAVQPEDVAFLQYTSGSTGNPKGVMLTQHGLLTNMRQMIAGMEITPGEIFVSWLPVYHDMGLILKTMVPLYLAACFHLLPTNLRDVRPWLQAIQEQRATFTAAPDFAYRLVSRHIRPGAYDLSSLRVALNAAEPVRASTCTAFEDLFHLKNVMTAGYGLAEATVGVCMSQPGKGLKVDSRGRVSVGRPFPGVRLRIHNAGKVLPPGQTGEIAIHSPANTPGYFHNPDETTHLFGEDGFLNSGDLGYLDEDGHLYIVSRTKDIIKRSGETISPQEIEEVVDALPFVRFSAATGIDKGGPEGEQPYVFAEMRDGESLSQDELYQQAVKTVSVIYSHMGFRPGRVYLLKPHSLPLTHNGKLQRGQLKSIYLDGSLREQGCILFPEY